MLVRDEISSVTDDNETYISWKRQFEKENLTKDELIRLLVKQKYDHDSSSSFSSKQISALKLELEYHKENALKLFEYKSKAEFPF